MGGSSVNRPGRRIVVDISEGRRIHYGARPSVDETRPVAALYTPAVSEADRSILAEASIRADMNNGDPGLVVLRKCLFVLENAALVFKDPVFLERTVTRILKVIRDYGEPEGAPLVREALSTFGRMEGVRKAASDAISRIGEETDSGLILDSLKPDSSAPDEHLSALRSFAYRYPEKAGEIAAALEGINASDARFQHTIRELKAIAAGPPTPAA